MKDSDSRLAVGIGLMSFALGGVAITLVCACPLFQPTAAGLIANHGNTRIQDIDQVSRNGIAILALCLYYDELSLPNLAHPSHTTTQPPDP